MEILFYLFSFVISMLFLYFAIQGIYENNKGLAKLSRMIHIDGIPNIEKGVDVSVSFFEDNITIDEKHIPKSRIKRVEVNSSKQLTEHQKSIIGRSIVGGLLLGPLGAVVGGVSGVGSNKVTKVVYILTIYFTDKDGNNQMAMLSLKRDGDHSRIKKACDVLNKKIGYTPVKVNESLEI